MDTVTDELGGVAEISAEFGVPRTTVSMWSARRETNGYPQPVADLRAGPVYNMDEVRQWFQAKNAGRESSQ